MGYEIGDSDIKTERRRKKFPLRKRRILEFIKLRFTYLRRIIIICRIPSAIRARLPEPGWQLCSSEAQHCTSEGRSLLPFIVCRLFKWYLPRVNLEHIFPSDADKKLLRFNGYEEGRHPSIHQIRTAMNVTDKLLIFSSFVCFNFQV